MTGKRKPGRRPLLARALATRLALPGFESAQVSSGDLKRDLAALPASRRAVFRYLAAHARNGVACPSQLRIAKAVQLHPRNVKKAIADLRRIGAITATEYDRSVPLKTVAAYALFAASAPPSNPGLKLPRKQLPTNRRSACENYTKQRISADPAADVALVALQREGVPSWAALRDVRRIGGATVLRRLAQARNRPAYVRGELRNPIGYVRRCVSSDFPPPPATVRIFATDQERERRRDYAIAMQRERDHAATKLDAAIAWRSFRDELRRRVNL